MCIRDRDDRIERLVVTNTIPVPPEKRHRKVVVLSTAPLLACLLYTSDAADERSSVDLGGRRIIKKNTLRMLECMSTNQQHTSKPTT